MAGLRKSQNGPACASRLADRSSCRPPDPLAPALLAVMFHALPPSAPVRVSEAEPPMKDWIARADRALYAAKYAGRNRVRRASEMELGQDDD